MEYFLGRSILAYVNHSGQGKLKKALYDTVSPYLMSLIGSVTSSETTYK